MNPEDKPTGSQIGRRLSFEAAQSATRDRSSNYPAVFAEQMQGRTKRPLGDPHGLTGFGVNLTELAPGAVSALFHRHSVQDEFVFVLEGEVVLVTDVGEETLYPGMCAAFRAGGTAHQIVNRSARPAAYLEVGDRRPGDAVEYPRDDLAAQREPSGWRFFHKDGRAY
ncbi:MAG: cupin domain-containing protein [Phenylobacterium sp.]|uniref:cupin domain-containing protein n=1 Tax=Phenylobacterium sp. TaxID=1871053 RepID=UPI00391A03DA